MQDQLRKLIEGHCTTIEEKARRLAALLESRCRAERFAEDSLKQALEIAHDIKGSSGSIGFDAICIAAAEVEHALKEISAAADGSEHIIEVSRRLMALMEAASCLRPQNSRLYNADLSAFMH